ncbi:hypothetical protein HDU85_003337 [Gaertneriomyces sp. JEL0708]|nr:hypothetical protein HDU85_003337 [Gaertneriomyces sp. JEL0708]
MSRQIQATREWIQERIPPALSRSNSAATFDSNNFPHPEGAVEIDPEHKRAVKIIGRIGFTAKAIIYGVLGAIIIRVALGFGEDSSPQGVFLLLGDNPLGIPILLVLAISLCFYIVWRFWEAYEGQGSDATYSRVRNFFRYRLSPLVSGLVYSAYTFYVIRTITISRHDRHADQSTTTTKSSFPDSWVAQGGGGKFGVAVIGLGFIIATLIQFKVALTGSFRRELYQNKLENRYLRWTVHTLGRLGFAARGLVFLLVAILMFQSLGHDDVEDEDDSITAKAIEKLRFSSWGKAILIILGVGLCLYATFAFLNVYLKIFPTPPPTRNPRVRDIETPDDVSSGEPSIADENTHKKP